MATKENILQKQMGNKLPFSVPDNYFEEFALEMDKQIAQKAPRKFAKRWLYPAAAAFIGILFVGQVFYSDYRKQEDFRENYETYILSQVGNADMMYYYLEESTY
ncbi:MAG: hypothetical protein LBS07_04680 [Prevotellaceae bacterium]|jgi:hypothetical protein|nr:hypothetical protein [Prevotellaceae bacterium]